MPVEGGSNRELIAANTPKEMSQIGRRLYMHRSRIRRWWVLMRIPRIKSLPCKGDPGAAGEGVRLSFVYLFFGEGDAHGQEFECGREPSGGLCLSGSYLIDKKAAGLSSLETAD